MSIVESYLIETYWIHTRILLKTLKLLNYWIKLVELLVIHTLYITLNTFTYIYERDRETYT